MLAPGQVKAVPGLVKAQPSGEASDSMQSPKAALDRMKARALLPWQASDLTQNSHFPSTLRLQPKANSEGKQLFVQIIKNRQCASKSTPTPQTLVRSPPPLAGCASPRCAD